MSPCMFDIVSNVRKVSNVIRRHSYYFRFFSSRRRFKFDQLRDSESMSVKEINELDEVSMVSLKTLQIPEEVKAKLHNIAKQFIKKKDLQRLGKFMSKKFTSRTCVEVPRILPSKLLCETEEEKNKIEKLLDKRSYKCLKEFIKRYEGKGKEIEQIALAYAEDSRHKINLSFFPEAAIAYTIHKFNGHFSVAYRIVHEIKKRVPDFCPKTFLNYCSVPGVGILAVSEIYKHPFDCILTVEASEHLTCITKYLVDHIKNVKYQMNLYSENAQKFDLILLSHTLLSLYDYESRNLFIKNIWSRLNTHGILIIIEYGTPTGFRMLHSIREMFITELHFSKFHIVAPCPHESICPLALTGKDWCHFSQRVQRLSHHIYCKGSRLKNVEEEKYSYLVLKKCEGPRTKYPNESAAPSAHEKSFFWPRVVMPTIKAGKHVLVDVCSYPYNFERLVVTKSAPSITNLKTKRGHVIKGFGYKNARKLMWGDLFRFTKRVTRPDARMYTPETTKKHLYRLYQKQKRRHNRATSGIDQKAEKYYDSRTIQYYGS